MAQIQKTNALKTFDFGSMEGQKQTDARNNAIHKNIINNPNKSMADEGESWNDAVNRVIPTIRNVVENDPAHTVVVTHNSVYGLIKLWNDLKQPDDFTKEEREKYTKQDGEFKTGDHFTIKGKNGPIYVVRHGETTDNAKKNFRRADAELTDKGVKQAEAVGKLLSKYKIPLIVSSSLPRAIHTSQIILSQQKSPDGGDNKKNMKSGGKLTASKARQILHDKEVHGHALTDKQRKFFGAVSSGYIKAQNGIEATMGGLTDKGFNFNPAWGGAWKNGGWLEKYQDGGDIVNPSQFAMGGSLPGMAGFMYARTQSPAPSEGKYAKKTTPSAQKGKEVKDEIEDDGGEDIKSLFKDISYIPSYGKERQQVINTLSNLPIYSPDERYAQYREHIQDWKRNIMATPAYVNLNPPHPGSSYYSTGAPAYDPTFPYSGTISLDPREFNTIQTPERVIGHEFTHAAFDGNRYIPEWLGENLYRTARHPEGFESGEHQDILGERAAMLMGARRNIIESLGLPKDATISREQFNYWARQPLETALRTGITPEQYNDILETFQGAKSASDVHKLLNMGIIPKQQQGGMTYYQHGLDWKPKTISEKGSKIAKAQDGRDVLHEKLKPLNLTSPSVSTSSGVSYYDPKVQSDIQKQAAIQKMIENQPQLKQARANTPYEEEERRRKNITYANQNAPYAVTDERGNLSTYSPNVSMTGVPIPGTPAAHLERGIHDIGKGLEAAGYVTGAGELLGAGYNAAKAALAESMESNLLSKLRKVKLAETPKISEEVINKLKLDEAGKKIFNLNDPILDKYSTLDKYDIQDKLKKIFTLDEPKVGKTLISKLSNVDYNKPLSNIEYDTWKKQIFGKDASLISDKELKDAHRESMDYFKGSIGQSGKEHGLYIKNKFADRIPNYTSIKVDDAGKRIYEGPHYSDEDQNTLRLLTDEAFQKQHQYDISKLTPQERMLMEAYAHGYDKSLNNALRIPGAGKVSQFYQENADALNQAILKNKFQNATTVRRGIGNDYPVELLHPETHEPLGVTKMRSQLTKGDVFKDDSFMSTSSRLDKTWGTPSLSEEIEIPGGGIQSLAVPEAATLTQFRGENEAILPKGLIRQVIEDNAPTDPVLGGAKYRTKILNPYLTIPFIGGAAALQKQKKGGIVKDNNGYWNPENWGKVVEIDSPNITMKGVNQPLIGISDKGDVQYMEPGKEYAFNGKKVREYPVGKQGVSVNKADEYPLHKLDDLLNFTNYNKPKAKNGWLEKYS